MGGASIQIHARAFKLALALCEKRGALTPPKPNGMGMGLSICRSIIEALINRLTSDPGNARYDKTGAARW